MTGKENIPSILPETPKFRLLPETTKFASNPQESAPDPPVKGPKGPTGKYAPPGYWVMREDGTFLGSKGEIAPAISRSVTLPPPVPKKAMPKPKKQSLPVKPAPLDRLVRTYADVVEGRPSAGCSAVGTQSIPKSGYYITDPDDGKRHWFPSDGDSGDEGKAEAPEPKRREEA